MFAILTCTLVLLALPLTSGIIPTFPEVVVSDWGVSAMTSANDDNNPKGLCGGNERYKPPVSFPMTFPLLRLRTNRHSGTKGHQGSQALSEMVVESQC